VGGIIEEEGDSVQEGFAGAGWTGEGEMVRWAKEIDRMRIRVEGASMRRTLVTIAAVLAAGFLAWEFVPLEKKIWDGGFHLTVHVESEAGQPLSVSCETFGRREHAEEALAVLLPPETRMWSTVADPFDGQPLTVLVPVSGRESPLGRELRRSQFRYLVVIAVLPDGRRVGKLVDIPDSRVSQEVSVSFP
jgi:hypothetical protein